MNVVVTPFRSPPTAGQCDMCVLNTAVAFLVTFFDCRHAHGYYAWPTVRRVRVG